ncbi:oligosaccharide flippase family protein, partial [Bacteroides sp. OttesenSCG-928-D19]|nr:oligosaccharide flippase family protein [Bacteroides sp. OttesenSCG-928-D19]
RMLLIMAVTLYTSRVVLATLGIEDFGIYNVVAGFVAMFGILSGTLSASISRFLTFELGAKNAEKLSRVFSTSVNVQIIISLVILLFSEIVGVWFLNTRMNIPDERMVAANWVFQFSMFTFIINLISVPYNASIIAHERMNFFAYVSILEVSLKLLIVYLLVNSQIDKLVLYALLLLLVSMVIRVIYGVYCKRNFSECNYHFILDKPLMKEMLSFAGWNFIGASSKTLKDQGVNVAINLFCGTVVNAARGVAMQVNTAVHSFVNNFMVALNPQITKSYASGDYSYMMNLIQQGARLSFYMLMILSLPIILEAEMILSLWLVEVPSHTVNFVRLVLINAMIESLSGTLITAMLASGKIRNYQLVVGGIQMLNFPLSYSLLKLNYFPEITLIIAIVLSVISLLTRLLFLRGMIKLSIRKYLWGVVFNAFFVFSISLILPVGLYNILNAGIIRLLVILLVSICYSAAVILFIGCKRSEREIFVRKLALIKLKYKMK